jgi:hypothetical protein
LRLLFDFFEALLHSSTAELQLLVFHFAETQLLYELVIVLLRLLELLLQKLHLRG